MPSPIAHHRSGSFDELLSQLDENDVYLLLTDLNNSRDVHIPVAKAINFYEKPRNRRPGHGHDRALPAKRAVSSPFLSSSHYHDSLPLLRNAAPPPPVPPLPLAATLARRRPLPPPSPQAKRSSIDQESNASDSKPVVQVIPGPTPDTGLFAGKGDPEPTNIEPSSAGSSCIEPSYVEPSSPGSSCIEPSYVEPSYIEPSYTELGDPEPDHITPSHTEASRSQPSYGYTESSCAEPSYVGTNFAESTDPAADAGATPPTETPKTSRAYKRISRPALAILTAAAAKDQGLHALLASHLFGGASCHSPPLSSPRSMVDLRMIDRQQEEEYYRPRDLLEPMVFGTKRPGAPSPSVLGKPLLWDTTSMDSLFAVLDDSRERGQSHGK